MAELPSSVDVAIVGAGPAGSAAALRLARAGCQVALFDDGREGRRRAGESLAPFVRNQMVDLGLVTAFEALDPIPSHGVRSLWGVREAEMHASIWNPYGTGWHVDRPAFDRMLRDAAASVGAELFMRTRVLGAKQNSVRDWCVDVQGPDGATGRLSARFLIDATGRKVALARQLGASRHVFDRLVAVSKHLPSDQAERGRILIETRPEGWWYAAPAGRGQVVVCLFTDSDLCVAGRFGDPAVLAQLMRQSCEISTLTDGQTFDSPAVYSAVSQRLDRRGTPDGWVAVGDAALATDPIAGDGVTRALRTAASAADAALAYLDRGALDCVEAYERDLDTACTRFLVNRAGFYGYEDRWSEHPFWQRRRAAAELLA